jgi:glycerol-3-phosphate dehydrogenase
MGAFPVRRGEADEESVETTRQLIARGHAVVIFPEGRRIRHGSLARPKRGVGRLVLETGAPVVPVAVTGGEHARRGWRVRPVKVHVRYGAPLTFPTVERPSPFLAREVTERIWPCVELQWEWLGGLPPLRTAAVVGAGSMGTALAAVLARAGLEVQLGCRTAAQAARLAADRENRAHLPGVPLPPAVAVTTVSKIEFAGVDLAVLAVPCASLPAAMGEVGARIGERSAVLVASKGLVPPLGTLPCAYVSERTHARAVAALAGPAVAREAAQVGASVVVASRDADLRRQLHDVLASGGFTAESTEDVTGAELAACARNAATLASAAAEAGGAGLAGAAAGRVFAEVQELALSRGASSETFVGLAGTGDLMAAALSATAAPTRAGEPGGAESLATVPLLGLAFEREGIDAPVTTGLRRMLAGDLSADQWLERVRTAAPRKRSRAA